MKFKLIYFILIFLIFFLIANIILIKSIVNNPIKLSYKFFNNYLQDAIIPEGWAFFTKDPQEVDIVLFEINGKDSLIRKNLKNSENLLKSGFSRKNRLIFSKLSIAVSKIESKYWTYSKNDSINLDSLSIITYKVKQPMLIGKYLIKLQKPVTWIWFSKLSKVVMPSKMIIIDFINE
jgi:antimicrobial peptide system SdpA family protein